MPKKAQKSKLKVTFSDNETFCFPNAIDTLIAVLQKIADDSESGSDIFKSIKLDCLTQDVQPEYEKYKKHIRDDWFYIHNLPNTEDQECRLIAIRKQLRLDFEIIKPDSNFKPTNKKEKGGKHISPRKFTVIFENGKCIDYDNFQDVFLNCVDKMGPQKIANATTNAPWHNNDIVTCFDRKDRERVKIAEDKWIIKPNDTKEAALLIQHIEKHLKSKYRDERVGIKKIKLVPIHLADVITWMEQRKEDGESQEWLRNVGKETDEELEEFIKRRQKEDGWSKKLSVKKWHSIVDQLFARKQNEIILSIK